LLLILLLILILLLLLLLLIVTGQDTRNYRIRARRDKEKHAIGSLLIGRIGGEIAGNRMEPGRLGVDEIPSLGREDRRDIYRQVIAQHGGPAYMRRARQVEEAFEALLRQCRRQRDEWLTMVRLRLAMLFALAGNWDALGPLLANEDQLAILGELHAALQPLAGFSSQRGPEPGKRPARRLQPLLRAGKGMRGPFAACGLARICAIAAADVGGAGGVVAAVAGTPADGLAAGPPSSREVSLTVASPSSSRSPSCHSP
jgi:hypothetical protein